MPQDRRYRWTLAKAEVGVPSEGMQDPSVLAHLEGKFQPCLRVLIRPGDLDRSGRHAPDLLVIFTGVLNLGDADARGTLAGEPKQFIS